MMTNLVDVEPDPAQLRIGMPVEVTFDDATRRDRAAALQAGGSRAVSRDAARHARPRRDRRRGRVGRARASCRTSRRFSCTPRRRATRSPTPASTLTDVDAVFSAGLWMGSETAEYLGIRPRYIDGTQIGGCSFIAHVQHAMAAIDAGVVDVALITHGESGASRVGMPGTRFGADAFRMQFEPPFGLAGPPTGYALAATRHMHEYGTTSEQLAEVAVVDAQVGAAEPARDHARPAHGRRRARVAHDRLAAPSARLLPGHRRGRRRRADVGRARARPAEEARSTCSAPARRRRT